MTLIFGDLKVDIIFLSLISELSGRNYCNLKAVRDMSDNGS